MNEDGSITTDVLSESITLLVNHFVQDGAVVSNTNATTNQQLSRTEAEVENTINTNPVAGTGVSLMKSNAQFAPVISENDAIFAEKKRKAREKVDNAKTLETKQKAVRRLIDILSVENRVYERDFVVKSPKTGPNAFYARTERTKTLSPTEEVRLKNDDGVLYLPNHDRIIYIASTLKNVQMVEGAYFFAQAQRQIELHHREDLINIYNNLTIEERASIFDPRSKILERDGNIEKAIERAIAKGVVYLEGDFKNFMEFLSTKNSEFKDTVLSIFNTIKQNEQSDTTDHGRVGQKVHRRKWNRSLQLNLWDARVDEGGAGYMGGMGTGTIENPISTIEDKLC